METCNRCKSDKIIISFENKYYNLFQCLDCNYMTTKRINECCRNSDVIVTIEHREDNLIRLYHQCLNCGGAFKTKPLAHKKFSDKIRTEFNITKFNDWDANRNSENEELSKLVKQRNSEKYQKYQKYLKSAEWKIIREKVITRDKNLCQECKTKNAEEVHHKTYENLYNEPLEDLVSLCKSCHLEAHRIIAREEMRKIKLLIEQNNKGIC